jgi:hypothetical protein
VAKKTGHRFRWFFDESANSGQPIVRPISIAPVIVDRLTTEPGGAHMT